MEKALPKSWHCQKGGGGVDLDLISQLALDNCMVGTGGGDLRNTFDCPWNLFWSPMEHHHFSPCMPLLFVVVVVCLFVFFVCLFD